jgi:glycosylphosphatidylinositol transamidase
MMASETSRKRKWLPFLLAPYIIGISWTCTHPILSVVTGEAKCRGWFVDENSLDTASLLLPTRYLPANPQSPGSSSLCETLLRNNDLRDNVDCVRHTNLEVTKVAPISNAVAPTVETIAIVIPAPEDWLASDFHNAILQLITRLSSPSSCPWLAKTILIVSPAEKGTSLHSTVSMFLDVYLGDFSPRNFPSSLPVEYTSGILRNLLVVNVRVIDTSSGENEVRILPQGRHGLLPNMDLVFTVMSMYSRSLRQYLIMHQYGEILRAFKSRIPQGVSPAIQDWAFELGSMFLFSYSLAMGPYPPHYVALDKGIDSLTIEGNLSSTNAADSVHKLEGVLRALSNLEERLHHSITQYLLPSPRKFVSHTEYLLPNILILLPLAIRAVTLILWDMKLFDAQSLKYVLVVGLFSMTLFVTSSRLNTFMMNALFGLIYIALCLNVQEGLHIGKGENQAQSLQFLTCLMAIYLHVPITFTHVSLAFPSSLLWSALIAFPTFPIQSKFWQRVKRPFMFAVALPLAAHLSNQLFDGFTPYVTTVFLPLHMLVSLLYLI